MIDVMFVGALLLVVIGLAEMFVLIYQKVQVPIVYRLNYSTNSTFIIENKIGNIMLLKNLQNGARLDVSVDYFNRYFVKV